MNKIFYKSGQWFAFEAPQEQECDQCDGCGWYEGGPTLKTTCASCNGSGLVVNGFDYDAAKAAALPVLNDDEIWKYIKRPGIEGKDYDWPGTIEKVDECSEGEKCTGSDRTCDGSAVWYYELKLHNSAHSYTEGAEVKQTDSGYKWFTCSTCDGLGRVTQDQVDENNTFTNSAIETAIKFGELTEENESLKQSLRELIELTKHVEDKWVIASHYWGSETEEKLRAVIDRAKSKLT